MSTYAVAKNAAGDKMIVSNRARGSSGAWVNNLNSEVLRSDGTAFLVFASTIEAEPLSGKVFHTVPNRVFYV